MVLVLWRSACAATRKIVRISHRSAKLRSAKTRRTNQHSMMSNVLRREDITIVTTIGTIIAVRAAIQQILVDVAAV